MKTQKLFLIAALVITSISAYAQVLPEESTNSFNAESIHKVKATIGVGVGAIGVPFRVDGEYKVADFGQSFSLGVGGQADIAFSSTLGRFYAGPMVASHFEFIKNLDLFAKFSIGPCLYTYATSYLKPDLHLATSLSVGGAYYFTDNIGVGIHLGYSVVNYAGISLAIRL